MFYGFDPMEKYLFKVKKRESRNWTNDDILPVIFNFDRCFLTGQ